jgi:hypothetical protein
MKLKLKRAEFNKWIQNIFFFTAPALVVLFSMLSQGVEFKKAYPVALLALYGILADYFKKLKK